MHAAISPSAVHHPHRHRALGLEQLRNDPLLFSMHPPHASSIQFAAFKEKMLAKGLSDAAISAFKRNYDQLVAGVTGLVPEASIEAVVELPDLRTMDEASATGG